MNVQLDNIIAVSMLIVRIPRDLTRVSANLAILEMELHVMVRKLKLLCENTLFELLLFITSFFNPLKKKLKNVLLPPVSH